MISDIIQIIGAIVAFILAGSIWGTLRYNKGSKDNQNKQKEIDHETARDIRKRAGDVERVSDDDLKFRD